MRVAQVVWVRTVLADEIFYDAAANGGCFLSNDIRQLLLRTSAEALLAADSPDCAKALIAPP